MEIRKKLPPKKGWVTRIEFVAASGHVYILAMRASGEYGCSCKGYINHRHCKHIDQYKTIVRKTILLNTIKRRGRDNGERS